MTGRARRSRRARPGTPPPGFTPHDGSPCCERCGLTYETAAERARGLVVVTESNRPTRHPFTGRPVAGIRLAVTLCTSLCFPLWQTKRASITGGYRP